MRYKNHSNLWALTVGMILAGGALRAAQAELTYVDLVSRLTDLKYLATVPAAGDRCAQWSSYDRASRYDAATGKYVGWDANGDGDGIIRKEGDKLVIAEMQGPGCIWRIWSAAPKEGHVRIYLDGSAEPAVDLPFIGYFDGKNAPFSRPALVHTVAMGWNNYTPIPYQKSCKVVADAGWGAYYQFNYETFPAGTRVPTFKRELSPEQSAALDRANNILARCDSGADLQLAGQKVKTQSVTVRPGKTVSVGKLKGPSAITRIRVKLDLPAAPADRDALRELAFQIRWDREKEPSVWSPLGDFFGVAGSSNYRSLPLGHTGDGWWYCNWYMPFGQEAQLELTNDGKTPRTVVFEISTAPLAGSAEGLARFHAKWHRDAFLPQEKERWIDWPIVKTEGAGRFVGVMLHVWNPRGGWWGEGDEKFFVDGEKFPSTIGTGSEDYFGYAWCCPQLFQNAYHNQPHNDGNNRGHVCVNRWHIADNIPFHKSFDGNIEKYYPNSRPTLYAATAYWYLAPGGNDPYRAVPMSERVGYWGPVETYRVKGAIEGEKLKVLGKTAGNLEEQDMSGFGGGWSGEAHLWWTGAKPGDKLDLALPVQKAGTYTLGVQFTKAPDYGIVQLYLDGQKIGVPLDTFRPAVRLNDMVRLDPMALTAGEHKLTIEITGANAKAIKSYMVGLDYVKLIPGK